MPLSLTYKAETAIPVEIDGLTPTYAQGKSLDEIAQFEIFHGNQKLPLGEMFDLEGEATDLKFDFYGNLSGVHWIGAQMSEGQIRIHGPAGRHIGSQMSGGQITVEGNADGWLGAEMHGGLIHVRGNAGHLVGAAYRGSAQGMTGGTILVDGNVGNEVGLTMYRGMIAIGGRTDDMLGFNMIDGTIFVFGECGIRPGAGMNRGTIALLGTDTPPLLPTFRYACTAQPLVMPIMLNHLRSQGFALDEKHLNASYDIYNGDLVALGKGEILITHNNQSYKNTSTLLPAE